MTEPDLTPRTAPATAPATVEWNRELVDQLNYHWTQQLRPRLDGLTDEEYFFEPVPGSWNVHLRGGRPAA